MNKEQLLHNFYSAPVIAEIAESERKKSTDFSLREQAQTTKDKYTSRMGEFKRLIKVSKNLDPSTPDGEAMKIATPEIVIQRDMVNEETTRGSVVAVIKSYIGTSIRITPGFEILYKFKPRNGRTSETVTFASEYFGGKNRHYDGLVLQPLPSLGYLSEEEANTIIEDSKKIEDMLAMTDSSLDMILKAAADHDLNPDIAPKIQKYYPELQPAT